MNGADPRPDDPLITYGSPELHTEHEPTEDEFVWVAEEVEGLAGPTIGES